MKSTLNYPAIADVYAVFEELTLAVRTRSSTDPDGLLVVYALADDAGAAVALGSSIAGAASLGIDPDAERLKLAIRNGVCDFSVNHLDEALRILKNEIRKKQPVSVGLVGDTRKWLAEMAARGVQPDFIAGSLDTTALFVDRGALVLGQGSGRELESKDVWWSVSESPARWLPVLDSFAAQAIEGEMRDDAPGGDRLDMRLRWLRAVPRYMVRVPEHYLKMSAIELERFQILVESGRSSGAVAASIRLVSKS